MDNRCNLFFENGEVFWICRLLQNVLQTVKVPHKIDTILNQMY